MRNLFLQHVGQTSPSPAMIDVDRAEGIYIYDISGKAFADMTSGICVSSLGHNHPVVVKAIEDQVKRYLHTNVYGEHVQHPQVRLAKLLADLLPDRLNMTYFTNSGSEATEGAIKLARKYTGRPEIIACKGGYHGSTIASMSLMSASYYTLAYQPSLPGVQFITFNHIDDLDFISEQTAAVIVEPIRGPAGLELPNKEYLPALRRRCNETGTLLVFDEIQCGIGRTGKMFAFEHFGIEPDILLLAKAFGGGMPIGALVSDREILSAFVQNPMLGYISTFGGHPVCCAAGYAALLYLNEHREYIESVARKEQYIKSLLTSVKINSIRSKGLMMAIDLGDVRKVDRVISACYDHGILIDRFLFDQTSFRIAPPLIISEEEITKEVGVIQSIIEKYA